VKLSPARIPGDRICELDVWTRIGAEVCVGHGLGWHCVGLTWIVAR
jgi:hypothetical protein